ncbi:hypothetical protein STXM2123_5035 [Streptomyces sp. F-3]|nr:hypothetical protein STXM2123_5035 [Streptomyces sp. F-3]
MVGRTPVRIDGHGRPLSSCRDVGPWKEGRGEKRRRKGERGGRGRRGKEEGGRGGRNPPPERGTCSRGAGGLEGAGGRPPTHSVEDHR